MTTSSAASVRRAIALGTLLACALVLATSGVALAWVYTYPLVDGADCDGCHEAGFESDGPHGIFDNNSRLCAACHKMHAAPGAVSLTVGDTVRDVCRACHDGTGAYGPYITLTSRGETIESEHRVETTSTVPGGSPSTGGSADYVFSGPGGVMTCSDCHSPHNNDVVEPYQGERTRSYIANGTIYYSSRLLKRRPNGSSYEIAEYGSDWCLACHKGRGSGGAVHNHPVETTATAGFFYYDRVSRVQTAGTSLTEIGTLGAIQSSSQNRDDGNFGYVMPYPRTADQAGHDPICQQCHEDARNVGDVTPGQIATLPVTDPNSERFHSFADHGGAPSPGTYGYPNPRYTVFPHQSVNPSFLLETDDDLCLNCHPPTGLP